MKKETIKEKIKKIKGLYLQAVENHETEETRARILKETAGKLLAHAKKQEDFAEVQRQRNEARNHEDSAKAYAGEIVALADALAILTNQTADQVQAEIMKK